MTGLFLIMVPKASGKDATLLALKTIEMLQPINDFIHTITANNGINLKKPEITK